MESEIMQTKKIQSEFGAAFTSIVEFSIIISPGAIQSLPNLKPTLSSASLFSRAAFFEN